MALRISVQFSSFSCSVVFNYLRPYESQHARPHCTSPTPRIHWDSRPSSQWCHLILCRPLKQYYFTFQFPRDAKSWDKLKSFIQLQTVCSIQNEYSYILSGQIHLRAMCGHNFVGSFSSSFFFFLFFLYFITYVETQDNLVCCFLMLGI